jgi:outer membrane protein
MRRTGLFFCARVCIALCLWNASPVRAGDTAASMDQTGISESVADSSVARDSTRGRTTEKGRPKQPDVLVDTTVSSDFKSDSSDSSKHLPIPGAEVTVHVKATIDVTTANEPVKNLTIQDAVSSLLENNPDLIAARLEVLSSQDKFFASFGNFEPALVGNYKYQETQRPYLIFGQTYNTYSGGIEGSLPTATKYSLNFSVSDIRYKFSDNTEKPSSFAGISVTQPLMQGLWFGRPVSDIRYAHFENEIAMQKYRSALSAKIGEVENAYWKLSYTQEKENFTIQSVETAKEILADSKWKIKAGKISQLEVVEASAGLATRLSNLADSRKEKMAAMNDLKLLMAGEKFLRDTLLFASSPLIVTVTDSSDEYKKALSAGNSDEIQPDYLQKKFESAKEHVVLESQSDQFLPELNLKGSYGYLVSLTSPDQTMQKFADPVYRMQSPTYSAEIELRIPLFSNIKGNGLMAAEKRVVQEAESNQRAIRTQIENYKFLTRKHLVDLKKTLENADIVVEYRETLLAAEIKRQKAGKSDYRKIFEIEEDLTKSKQWQLENLLDFKSTIVQLSRLNGTTLLDNNLESLVNGKPVLIKILTSPTRRR